MDNVTIAHMRMSAPIIGERQMYLLLRIDSRFRKFPNSFNVDRNCPPIRYVPVFPNTASVPSRRQILGD